MPAQKTNDFVSELGSSCATVVAAAPRNRTRNPPSPPKGPGEQALANACYHRGVSGEGKSGKRVVVVLLVAAVGVSLIAWLAASRLERGTKARQEAAGELQGAAVVDDGVIFETTVGDPGFVIAKDVGSGKELWRAELGAVTAKPGVKVEGERVEVEIAGTPWMTLDRTTGEAVE